MAIGRIPTRAADQKRPVHESRRKRREAKHIGASFIAYRLTAGVGDVHALDYRDYPRLRPHGGGGGGGHTAEIFPGPPGGGVWAKGAWDTKNNRTEPTPRGRGGTIIAHTETAGAQATPSEA